MKEKIRKDIKDVKTTPTNLTLLIRQNPPNQEIVEYMGFSSKYGIFAKIEYMWGHEF